MSTNNYIFDNRLDIVRDLCQKIESQRSDTIETLFKGPLKLISEALDCNTCGVFEVNTSGTFNLINGYKKQSIPHIKKLLDSTYTLAEATILMHQTYCVDIKPSDFIYYVPIKSVQPTYFLMFCFKQKFSLKGIELLESIAQVFSTDVDKILFRQQLHEQYLSTVKSLVNAIEAKDVYTQGHSQRVANYSKIIGRHLNMNDDEINELEITGLVHDVGKIGVSDSLLTKPNGLTELEFNSIKQHPEIGIKILKPLRVSENVIMGTLLHHKRYDLKGYPNNMDIDKLPLVPAIIGVADAYDAMTSERTYKKTISKSDALLELKKNSGTQFDPYIVEIVEELLKSNIF